MIWENSRGTGCQKRAWRWPISLDLRVWRSGGSTVTHGSRTMSLATPLNLTTSFLLQHKSKSCY